MFYRLPKIQVQEIQKSSASFQNRVSKFKSQESRPRLQAQAPKYQDFQENQVLKSKYQVFPAQEPRSRVKSGQ